MCSEIAETANYSAGTATADFTIKKAGIQPKVSIKGWNAGNTANKPSVTGNPGEGAVTFTYAVKGSAKYTGKAPADAGEYTVKAEIAETANYLGGEATADFTIVNVIPKADFVTPKGLKKIDKSAFEGIGAVNVRINDGVTVIRSRAFANCKKLRSIYIPTSVKACGSGILAGCKNVTVYGNSPLARRVAKAYGFKYVVVK